MKFKIVIKDRNNTLFYYDSPNINKDIFDIEYHNYLFNKHNELYDILRSNCDGNINMVTVYDDLESLEMVLSKNQFYEMCQNLFTTS